MQTTKVKVLKDFIFNGTVYLEGERDVPNAALERATENKYIQLPPSKAEPSKSDKAVAKAKEEAEAKKAKAEADAIAAVAKAKEEAEAQQGSPVTVI